jgi:hypothetical protein
MWLCTLKSDEEKSKYAGLGQENNFGPAYVLRLLVQQSCAHAREECNNMIWLLIPDFDWKNIMIGPGGLISVVPTYLQS